jgi:acyl-CoA synthetase (AMP-forming)/AMP-acid ligase II
MRCAMSKRGWSVHALLADLAVRGSRPAVIADTAEGIVVCDAATLADNALRLTAGLRARGLNEGSRVGVWAPNSVAWVASALAVLAGGAVLVPFDDFLDAKQLDAAVVAGQPALVLTTAAHVDAAAAVLHRRGVAVTLIEASDYLRRRAPPDSLTLPVISADAPAQGDAVFAAGVARCRDDPHRSEPGGLVEQEENAAGHLAVGFVGRIEAGTDDDARHGRRAVQGLQRDTDKDAGLAGG